MNPTGDSRKGNGTPPAPLGAGTGGQEEAPDSATSLLRPPITASEPRYDLAPANDGRLAPRRHGRSIAA